MPCRVVCFLISKCLNVSWAVTGVHSEYFAYDLPLLGMKEWLYSCARGMHAKMSN